ncbi:minor tail protein [Gordonia phage Sukkupi]|uniref:Minor tail protein n=1 Tax=Gordonia phage Sukkupi TaxID=2653747 RepID=A0A5Q2WN46_9CAUD|nr:minor tail protein [Gordonia phage Sukkupi]QGH79288.1 minor tail protein [Gordonia phage Sukkupi]QGH80761.1 minor tail protein [Gordonia phage Yndexa]
MTDAIELNRRTPEELLRAGEQLALKADIWDPASVSEIVAKIFDLFGLDIPNWQDALANFEHLKDAIAGNYVGSDLALNAIQNIIGSIRKLATGLINPSRLPLIPFSHIGESYPNLLENGGFDGADSLDGEDVWTWDAAEGRTTPGSARTYGDGTRKVLLSNLVEATPGQKFQLAGWVKWSGLTGGANALRVSAVAYNGDAVLVETPLVGQSDPPSSNGWTQFSGTYEMPEGSTGIRVQVEVGATVTTGTIWWDDIKLSKYGSLPQRFISGLVDALGDLGAGIVAVVSQIGDFFDRVTGRVGATIADIQEWVIQLKTILSGGVVGSGLLPTLSEALRTGVNNLQTFVQNIIDTILSALRKVPVIGGILGDVEEDMGRLATTAESANSVAITSRTLAQSTIYNIATNRPLWSGLDPTAEVSFPWAELGYSSTQVLSTQTLTNTISRIAKVRCQVDQVMNTVAILASRSSTQQLNLNIYQFNKDDAKWVRIYTSPSPGFGALIGPALNRVTMKISEDGIAVNAGEMYAFEFIASGGSITIASKNFPVAPIPGVAPGAIGGSRNPTTVGDFTEISNALMESYNDTNTPYVEFGSDLGQLEIPRHYFVSFDNSSWQNWIRNTQHDSQLAIANGRVVYGDAGTFDAGLKIAVFGSQTKGDVVAVQADLFDLKNSAFVALALAQTNETVTTLENNCVLAIYGNKAEIMTGGTVRATHAWTLSSGTYRLRRDIDEVTGISTFYGEFWNGTRWVELVNWPDSGSIVAEGPGRRFGAIGIRRALVNNGGEIDNFHLYDIEE